ncbi:MAG: hypothetical protein R3B95_11755 [Nitrospirales bacterium]|nr:hypothetical protein [Nitrospirales bacterium]
MPRGPGVRRLCKCGCRQWFLPNRSDGQYLPEHSPNRTKWPHGIGIEIQVEVQEAPTQCGKCNQKYLFFEPVITDGVTAELDYQWRCWSCGWIKFVLAPVPLKRREPF